MLRTNEGIVRGFFLLLLVGRVLAFGVGPARADESLLIYPSASAIFQYDPSRYSVLATSDSRYVPAYGVAGGMLWDNVDSCIALDVYRAPSIIRFEPSPIGENRFVVMQNDFDIIVDGYFATPRTWSNLYLRYVPGSSTSRPLVDLDGGALTSVMKPIPGFATTTPTGDGHFADTRIHHIHWSGALSIRILVFSDRNFNRAFDDAPPRVSIVAQDAAVPTRKTSWGALKSLYR